MVVKYLTIFISADDGVCLLRGWADSTCSILGPDSEFIFAALLQIGYRERRLYNIYIVGLHPDLRRQVTLLNDVACQSVAAIELRLSPLKGYCASGNADHIRFTSSI